MISNQILKISTKNYKNIKMGYSSEEIEIYFIVRITFTFISMIGAVFIILAYVWHKSL